MSVSSVCIAAAVPATTGLRHLVALEGLGLITRDYDPFSYRRRCFVRLADPGLAMMEKWLSRFAGDLAADTVSRRNGHDAAGGPATFNNA